MRFPVSLLLATLSLFCMAASAASDTSTATETSASTETVPVHETLSVKFQFAGNRDCLQKLNSSLGNAEGQVELPDGFDAAAYCLRLFPGGIKEASTSITLPVVFQFSSESACETDLTSGIAAAGGSVVLPLDQTVPSYCQSLSYGPSAAQANNEVSELGTSNERSSVSTFTPLSAATQAATGMVMATPVSQPGPVIQAPAATLMNLEPLAGAFSTETPAEGSNTGVPSAPSGSTRAMQSGSGASSPLAMTAAQSSAAVQPGGSQLQSCVVNGSISGTASYASCVAPLVSGGAAAQSSLRQYGFAPHHDAKQGTDFWDLFQPDSPWQTVTNNTNVFFIDAGAFDAGTDAQLQQLISYLKQHGIKLGIGAGPLTPSATCGSGVEGFQGPRWASWSDRIQSFGGTIDVVAFDEPYFFAHTYDGPQACHWSNAQIAQALDQFMKTMRVRFPNIVFWDGEPNFTGTNTDTNANEAWLAAFEQTTGYPMPGFIVEFDAGSSRDIAAEMPDLKALESYAKQNGSLFGVLYDSPTSGQTSAQWFAEASQDVVTYELKNGGNPDIVLFVSWVDQPAQALPETTPWTFSNFAYRYFTDKFQNPDFGHVRGVIDGLGSDPATVNGWACGSGMDQSIDVHLYLGGEAGTGIFGGAATANIASEPEVAKACSANGKAYRFRIPISQDVLTQQAGKTVWVHGISPVGGTNDLLANSGNFSLPGGPPPPPPWANEGTGHFNGDGKADILWYNDQSGEVSIWYGGTTPVVAGTVPPGSGWAYEGIGDFNGDGKSDILWYNNQSGEVSIWYGGTTPVVAGTVPPGSGWSIIGIGDPNGDGKSDVLWHNVLNGQSTVWYSGTP